MIKLFDCSIPLEQRIGIGQIFDNGEIVDGRFTSELEIKLKNIYEMDCILFSDMTTALAQLFKLLDLKSGDKVLCHPFCCLSSTMAIKLAGLNVEWIPLDKKNMCIDIGSLCQKISEAKVLLNYNVAGFLPDLEKIENLCSDNNVYFINDCNNSELSKVKGKFSVQYGDYSILSFYPNRTFGAIDGAAIMSNKKDLRGLFKFQRLGISRHDYRQANGLFNPMHEVDSVAGRNTISNISARLVLNKLTFFSETILEKRRIFGEIIKHFRKLTISPSSIYEIVPWAVPIFVKDAPSFHENMNKIGIEATELHFDNSKYSLFGKKENKLHPFPIMWLPLDQRILNHSKEIIFHAS